MQFGYDIYFGSAIEVASYPFKGRVIPKLFGLNARAEVIVNNFKDWVKDRNNAFFGYLHFSDLHVPLYLPKKFTSHFGKIKNIPNLEYWRYRHPVQQKGDKFEEYKENKILLYDTILRYVDFVLEDLHNFLEDRGLLDNTVVIITADHGEEFWEHGELEYKYFFDPRGVYGTAHGHNLFNELVEVPVLFDGCVHGNGDMNGFISLVDISPTLYKLLDIQHNIKFDGVNIFGRGVNRTKRAIISEAVSYGYEKKALFIGDYKFLYSPKDGVEFLFDLKRDPHELNPIVDEEISTVFKSKLHKTIMNNKLNFLELKY